MHACMLSHFSLVWLCAILWTAAYQSPLSTGFSRQEYWSGLPFPSPCGPIGVWNLCILPLSGTFEMCVSIKGSRCVLKKCGEFLSGQVLHQTYLTKESPTPSQDGVVPAWNISLLGRLWKQWFGLLLWEVLLFLAWKTCLGKPKNGHLTWNQLLARLSVLN